VLTSPPCVDCSVGSRTVLLPKVTWYGKTCGQVGAELKGTTPPYFRAKTSKYCQTKIITVVKLKLKQLEEMFHYCCG